MGISDALWSIFENTGHIGAYLLYKDYKRLECGNNQEDEADFDDGTLNC
ncbi:MAG TPA: YqzL family protein [Peptococcaceae bacterium]|nr:MAG: hypothetical protein XD50_1465 [Clostridia bacterium 41_269]HBT20291.1 YqzL family protein [Peptococcaceae bacterium]